MAQSIETVCSTSGEDTSDAWHEENKSYIVKELMHQLIDLCWECQQSKPEQRCQRCLEMVSKFSKRAHQLLLRCAMRAQPMSIDEAIMITTVEAFVFQRATSLCCCMCPLPNKVDDDHDLWFNYCWSCKSMLNSKIDKICEALKGDDQNEMMEFEEALELHAKLPNGQRCYVCGLKFDCALLAKIAEEAEEEEKTRKAANEK